MSETAERRPPLKIQMGDLQVGDVYNSNNLYRDNDESQGAVCEGVEIRGTLVTATWRMVATGEVFTQTRTTMTTICLMRRAASVSARDLLWDELDLDLRQRPISREQFDAYMDAYDQAVRPANEERAYRTK